MIEALCPSCGQTVKAKYDDIGSIRRCGDCDAPYCVPSERVTPGTRFGDYEIQRPLGVGASGEVHLASHVHGDGDFAIKILFLEDVEDEIDVKRFMREARNAADLDHPNVVRIFDANQQDNVYYLVMEYVEGDPVDKMIRQHGALDEIDAIRVVRDVALALQYAWDAKKLLHRDVKPANVMLDFDGNAKLMDLGIAKSLMQDVTQLTDPETIIGTPYYMSPEQCAPGKPIDCRADIYSLGVTAYHMITEEVPFGGRNAMEVIRRQMFDSVPNPRELNPEISTEFAELIAHMTAKSASKRPADWNEFLALLEPLTRRLTF